MLAKPQTWQVSPLANTTRLEPVYELLLLDWIQQAAELGLAGDADIHPTCDDFGSVNQVLLECLQPQLLETSSNCFRAAYFHDPGTA